MAMEDAKTIERETWGSPLEFLLSCIAMSVGLGIEICFLPIFI
jgi:solute carrier family 6 amino acid transporter-like protein 5/7/9/14